MIWEFVTWAIFKYCDASHNRKKTIGSEVWQVACTLRVQKPTTKYSALPPLTSVPPCEGSQSRSQCLIDSYREVSWHNAPEKIQGVL